MINNAQKPMNRQLQKDQREIQKLENELQEKVKLAEGRLNQIKCLQADFENYKKSVEKEKQIFITFANESLIKELLNLIDDFERAIQSAKNKETLSGLKMIYKNFLKILRNYGLKKIEGTGRKFDPYYHEAILKEESDKEDGIILEELQKGYLLNSKVLRHAKVKVLVNKREKKEDNKLAKPAQEEKIEKLEKKEIKEKGREKAEEKSEKEEVKPLEKKDENKKEKIKKIEKIEESEDKKNG